MSTNRNEPNYNRTSYSGSSSAISATSSAISATSSATSSQAIVAKRTAGNGAKKGTASLKPILAPVKRD
eukprot:7436111-Ditylum_brightwellii.AAC.1